ncbi:hypothetical protein [Calothrix sp. UHCC 0171]|uniref:hypothetical protein n=1 Tax=Calothrix sp. UHCC 0171 TaxID=3110245 RepID=UPI003A521505
MSIDSKAKVKIGNLSRNGYSRTIKPRKADDHDSEWSAVLVPFEILDVQSDRLSIYFWYFIFTQVPNIIDIYDFNLLDFGFSANHPKLRSQMWLRGD